MKKNQWALISGASSGIGEATAYELAKSGYSLLLGARRTERLKKLAEKIQAQYPSTQILFSDLDVCSLNSIKKFADQFADVIRDLDVLVNSAGLAAGVEKVQDAQTQDWDAMIDTNVKGLLYLTREILPKMIQKKSGTIINIGSVAGRWVYPGGAVYCASKHAVKAITEGIRMDTLGSGVRVCNIEPGMVETEFSVVRLKDEAKAKQVYANMTPLSAYDIAKTIAWVVSQPAHINIQELVIYPTDQAHVGQVHRHV